MKHCLLKSILFGFAATSVAFAAPSEYTIDKGHSSVTFEVRHMLSKTVGTFDDFNAKVQFEAGKLESLKVEAEVAIPSINTKLAKRDEHLKSPDFFDASKFPTMTLKNTKVTDVKKSKAKLKGDLTMHGVTKPVEFDLEYLGNVVDPWGNHKAAFTATTKLNRKDFGLTWNKLLETGQMVVGEEVKVELNIEADEVLPKADDKKAADVKKEPETKKDAKKK